MPDLRVRAAVPADRQELLRMRRLLLPQEEDEHEREIDLCLSGHPRQVSIVAERAAGGLGGFVEVGERSYAEGCEDYRVAYIEAWYVDPDLRRRGVGQALFAAAADWARASGYREMGSDAELHNQVSIAAHRAAGWEEVVRIVCFRRRL